MMLSIKNLPKDISNICISYISEHDKMYYYGKDYWEVHGKHHMNINVCYTAAEHGWLDFLVWYYKDSSFCIDFKTCNYAAKNGKIEVLKWAIKKYPSYLREFYTDIYNIAAFYGHLDIIKWARGSGLSVRPKDESICDDAIRGNHFEIFEWIKKNGFACDHINCGYAAKTRNLKLLIYLREERYYLNKKVCEYAKINKDTKMLEWLEENGCRCNNEYH